MNENEVHKQIDQMVKFIKQEAEEKANEIRVSAEEEFNLEKMRMLDIEKQKIKKEYERKDNQLEVKKKIEYSKRLNESRLQVLDSRQKAIGEILKEAKLRIVKETSNQGKYTDLLLDLLVQAAHKLEEPQQLVRARQGDLPIVKGLLDKAAGKFRSVYKLDPPKFSIDDLGNLPPAPANLEDTETPHCCGGVLLTSTDGRIVCSNTFDDRLEIAFQQNLPEIRAMLFGASKPVRD